MEKGVLILVLVEDGLGETPRGYQGDQSSCLNPCFSGGWSRSKYLKELESLNYRVLILVLVEDGLGEG